MRFLIITSTVETNEVYVNVHFFLESLSMIYQCGDYIICDVPMKI